MFTTFIPPLQEWTLNALEVLFLMLPNCEHLMPHRELKLTPSLSQLHQLILNNDKHTSVARTQAENK